VPLNLQILGQEKHARYTAIKTEVYSRKNR